MVRRFSDPALGISRREPSLYFGSDGRADRARRLADHLVSPGRLEFDLCNQRRKECGNQFRDESARWFAPEQPGRAFRSVRVADRNATDRQDIGRGAWNTWKPKRLERTFGNLRRHADLTEAAAAGSERAKVALELFATDVRSYIGSYMVELGGVDAIVFTGGIGENQIDFRARVCRDLQSFRIELDPRANESAEGEGRISTHESPTGIWVVPTNEELIVARQTKEYLENNA